MIRWKEAKMSEEKNNVAVLIDSVSGREANQGVSAGNLLREAAAEIEERANSRLKVSQWRAEKKLQEEQASVIIDKNDSSHFQTPSTKLMQFLIMFYPAEEE